MTTNPDRPAPEGWVYIEHPDLGRGENPVRVTSLGAWTRNGWVEASGTEPVADDDPDATVSRRRTARVVADSKDKE